jgi:hypothetical protein
MYGHIRAAYARQVKPPWPTTRQRIADVYKTIARPIHKPDDKSQLFETLQEITSSFDEKHEHILMTQGTFQEWFLGQINKLGKIHFTWEQSEKSARKIARTTISFGAAQKCISLLIKDWWSVSPNADKASERCSFLYAPFDGIVYVAIRRYLRVSPYKSLLDSDNKDQSYVYHLSEEDYFRYQSHLDRLASGLSSSLNLSAKLHRIEVEQIIWGWAPENQHIRATDSPETG